ncbi:MAG: LysR substrate-binding domain-containing protein [Parasphingorhabdus sp.]
MQIQKLEDGLGVTIFDRSRSPVRITEIGEKIISQGRNILREANRVKEIINDESNNFTGQFKLGIIPTVAPLLLPYFLNDFLDSYPEIKVTIDELHTKTILDYLERDIIDAGIIALPVENEYLAQIPLYEEEFFGFVSENHRLASKKKLNAEDLSPEDLLLLKEGHCLRDQVLQICNSDETRNGHSIVFEAGSLETLTNLVQSGYGMTLLPAMLKPQFTNGKSHFVKEFEGPKPKRTIGIIHQKSYLKKNIIEALTHTITNGVSQNEMAKIVQSALGKKSEAVIV